jgi:hypothetical protein
MGIIEDIKRLEERIEELSVNDRNIISEYLDHNEWGIAFEHIVGTILINKINIKEDVFNTIKNLSMQMAYEKDTWERLIPFVK